jgi:NDP-hexose-3-ketoreductase
MNCKQLNVGVIACSSIARRRFLPAVASLESLKIWRIGSRDIQKARDFAEMFSAPHFGTYEDILNDKSVDLIYISTPPHSHFELTAAALNAGKHVICEKPITNNLAELIKLNEIATKNRLVFAEHYSFLHHGQHKIVKNLIKDGKIGKVLKLSGQYLYPMPSTNDIRLKSDILGGVSHDSLGYPIAAGLFFITTNPLNAVSSIKINKELNIDQYCSFNINFGETEACGEVGMGECYQSNYKIIGALGTINVHRAYSVEPDYEAVVSLKIKNITTEFTIPKSNQIREFLKCFIENIAINFSNNQYRNDFYDAAYRLRAIQDKIIKNAKILYN